MINPTDPSGMPVQSPIYNPMMPVGQNEEQELPQPSQSASSGSPFSSIDKQFNSLIKDLQQQLSALEKQLMQALRDLKLGRGSTTKAPAQPSGGAQAVPSTRYGSIINDAARRNEVDPQLVSAVIGQESGFRADAVSRAGAMGLMQLMPDTARSLGVTNPFDPKQNVQGGTALLRELLDRYHGQLDLALAAYNAGPAAVDKYGGVPPFAETQAYVRNIMASYRESALSA